MLGEGPVSVLSFHPASQCMDGGQLDQAANQIDLLCQAFAKTVAFHHAKAGALAYMIELITSA
jgi:hypothetical protein